MRINYNAAAPGTNRLMEAFLSPTRKNAEQNEMARLAQVDQRMASAGKDNAEAGLLNQRSAYLEDQPGFLSGQTGAPLPLAQKFADYLKTGNWGQTESPSSTDAEGALMAGAPPSPITDIPEEIKPLMEKFTRALQTQSGLRGASAANPEQIARSQGEYQGQGITDTAVALAQQGKIDQASALSQAGKIGQQIKRYDNIAGTGAVFSPATGEVLASDNPLVKAFVKKASQGPKAPANYRFLENGDLEFIPGGGADPDKKSGKALPTSAANKIFENQKNLRKAQKAFSLISGENIDGATGDKTATGFKGFLPEAILQRTDKKGIETRAAIADLGGMIIHDRSGAAVTASEYPRLIPFIPMKTDDPSTVVKKLKNFVNEYKRINEEMTGFYSESGYKVPEEKLLNMPPGISPNAPPNIEELLKKY